MNTNIQNSLIELADPGYKEFHSKLIPNISTENILGVRVPVLRNFAKHFPASKELFMDNLPHRYYEENNLHAIFISELGDFHGTVAALDRFLPFVDNWATCDMLAPKTFNGCPDGLVTKIKKWIADNHEYTVRFGICTLLRYYLGESFSVEYLDLVASIRRDHYYINMMIAWYFATALARQYDAVLPYLTQNRLSVWTHNKTIQKAIESYRIPPKRKQFLRTLRRK